MNGLEILNVPLVISKFMIDGQNELIFHIDNDILQILYQNFLALEIEPNDIVLYQTSIEDAASMILNYFKYFECSNINQLYYENSKFEWHGNKSEEIKNILKELNRLEDLQIFA